MNRAILVALTLTVGAQAVASGGTAFVCRYTGEVLETCCCHKAPSERQGIDRGCCCDVREKAPRLKHATVVRVDSAVRLPQEISAAPRDADPSNQRLSVCARDGFALPRLYPGKPLYAALRQLLI